MELSFMSFSMIMEAASGGVNADTLCFTASENGARSLDLMDIEIKLYHEDELRTAMEKYGVSCGCIITTPSFYSNPDKVEGELREALELTRKMGAGTLMVVPGATGRDEQECLSLSRDEMKNRAVEMYTLAVKLGEEYAVKIGFENTPADYKPLASAKDCRELLDKVPGLGFIFDTGNFRVADTNCDELAAYELLKDRIIRVHIKDVVIGDFDSGEGCVDGQKIRAVTTGSGVIPVEKILNRLSSDGYTGSLAVEYSAPMGVKGREHEKWLRPYVTYIKNAWENTLKRPPYARIGGMNKPLSRIFFGTAIIPMMMGHNVDALLDAVLSSGINAFDCARGYGKAEESLGNWIRSRNNRDRIVVLTKCGNVDMEGNVHINRSVIEEELAQSLDSLGTDYIDIYLLHRDDPNTSAGEIIECLNEAKRQGKIRVFGVSNWTHKRIEEANRYALEHGLEGFSVSSPNYGLTRQLKDPWGGGCISISGPENAEARRWYTDNQMPVIAYSSLGRGFFSGKFKAGDYDAAKKVLDPFAQKGYLYEENMECLKRAETLAERDHSSVAGIAMRYVFGSPMNVFAIVSTTNAARLESNIDAALSPLSREDIEYLEGD